MEELMMAAEELPVISQTLRDLAKYARDNKVSTVALTETQTATVKATLKCIICRGLYYMLNLLYKSCLQIHFLDLF